MKYCCKEFKKQVEELQSPIAGGLLYPEEMLPGGQFEIDDEGNWYINGCCGGGCHVVDDMKYCPYCGTSLIN